MDVWSDFGDTTLNNSEVIGHFPIEIPQNYGKVH